jgi:hypothetical protein
MVSATPYTANAALPIQPTNNASPVLGKSPRRIVTAPAVAKAG